MNTSQKAFVFGAHHIYVASASPNAAVFTHKLVASVGQRMMLEKALGQVKVDSDWSSPDPDEE